MYPAVPTITPGFGLHQHGGVGRPGVGGRRAKLGDAEVENLHASVTRDHHVLGFQVPVNDPFRVRSRESAGNRGGDFARPRRRNDAPAQSLAQRFAVEKLGNEIWPAVRHPHVVEREDVGMSERARRAGFLFESSQAIGVAGVVGRQHLDRDLTADPRVAPSIDTAHAAHADQALDRVRADGVARVEFLRGVRHGHRWHIPSAVSVGMSGEHGLDLASERSVAEARVVQEPLPLSGRVCERGVEHSGDLLPALRGHGGSSESLSGRRSA